MNPVSRQLAAVTVAAATESIPAWARHCLSQPVDWSVIDRLATAESMLPLVHRARTRLRLKAVPPETADRAHAAYRETAVKNLRRITALHTVLSALTRQNLPVVVMQGASLWWPVYGDPGLRPVSDIDLWIPIREATPYCEVFASLGFNQDARYPDTFRSSDVTLDIHRHLLWADRIDARRRLIQTPITTVLDRTLVIGDADGQMRILSEFDQALYLTLHLAKHHIGALGWVADLLLLTHRWDSEKWNQFKQVAGQWGRSYIGHFLGHVMERFSGEALPVPMDAPDPVSRWLIRQRLGRGRVYPWASAWVLPARLPVAIQWRYALEAIWPDKSVLEQIFADRLPASHRRLILLRLGQLAFKAGLAFGRGKG